MQAARSSSGSGEKLRALRRSAGGWTLHIEKLVRVSPDYYKPTTTQVKGEREILARLARAGGRALVENAREAMASGHPHYTIRADGRFEPSEVTPSMNPAGSEDLKRLNQRCRSLEYRVDALESMLKHIARASMAPRPMSATPRTRGSHTTGAGARDTSSRSAEQVDTTARAQGPDERPDSSASVSASAAKAEAAKSVGDSPSESAEPAAEDTAGVEGAEAAEAAAAEEETGPRHTPPESDPLMAFPPPEDYAKALENLIGEEVPLSDASNDWLTPEGEAYFTELLTDSDEVIGAMIVNLPALVFQGGTLMMMGEDVLKEMLDEGLPSEDVVEAMQEIVNVQSRCLNDIEGNPHLRIRGFRKVEEGDEWLFEPLHRISYEDSFGGKTMLASK